MKTLKVEFSETDRNTIINQVVEMAQNEPKCHESHNDGPDGHEFEPIRFNDEIAIFARVFICDGFWQGSPVRHVSTDIKVISVEGFYPVESNLNYMFEDQINKALIALR